MAQVIVRVSGKEVTHEYAFNSDAYHYAAECKEQGYTAFVRPDPEVGMGATLQYPQDAYPFVITRVSPSGKTVWVKPVKSVDKSTGHEPAHFEGPWPVWHHVYSPAELEQFVQAEAPERMVRKVKYGWASHGTPYSIGQAVFHRNYSY